MALIHIDILRVPQNSVQLLIGLKVQAQESRKIFVSGFPDLGSEDSKIIRDKVNSNGKQVSTILKDDKGEFKTIIDNEIYYRKIATMTGQSGGPILTVHNDNLFIVGMHNQYSSSKKTGKGLFFSTTILSILENWAQRFDLTISPDFYCHFNRSI